MTGLQLEPGSHLVTKALVVDIGGVNHDEQLGQQSACFCIVAGVLRRIDQSRNGFKLQRGKAMFSCHRARLSRLIAQARIIAGLSVQVDCDLLAGNDFQPHADPRRRNHGLHPGR